MCDVRVWGLRKRTEANPTRVAVCGLKNESWVWCSHDATTHLIEAVARWSDLAIAMANAKDAPKLKTFAMETDGLCLHPADAIFQHNEH